MSEQHAKRIRQVGREISAAVEVLDKGSQYGSANRDFYRADLEDISRAVANSEDTYFFRLVAELEGMLFRHLKDYFVSFMFDEDDGARKLLNHSRTRLGEPKNDKSYRELAFEVEEVIEWRNYVVHGKKGLIPPRIPLSEAESRVHDLVRLLPAMKEPH